MISQMNDLVAKNANFRSLGNYLTIQAKVFEDLLGSFIFNSIFDENRHFAIRQLLATEISCIFYCELNTDKLEMILNDLNYAAMVILEGPPKRISNKIV
ncbi:unnamed protein product [Blepharisma stoltei]|uniref:Uncharacterized protein n=1 Tax=Blepharisma stoltei TaxID=1481888 RepID=A0AAU9J9R5_9CILI|nr:unnamed protein product [Blepharisma stoltei]